MGPAGIGVLYGKKERLDVMEPLWYGGGMVDVVGNEDTSFTTIPYRLEAGTPNYPGALFAGNRYKRDCGMGERTDGYAGTETFRTEICARTGRKCGKTECDLCGGRRHSSIRYGKFSE